MTFRKFIRAFVRDAKEDANLYLECYGGPTTIFLAIVMLALVALLLIGIVSAFRENRICKRRENYACTQMICHPLGKTISCIPMDSTCSRCVEYYAEEPE